MLERSPLLPHSKVSLLSAVRDSSSSTGVELEESTHVVNVLPMGGGPERPFSPIDPNLPARGILDNSETIGDSVPQEPNFSSLTSIFASPHIGSNIGGSLLTSPKLFPQFGSNAELEVRDSRPTHAELGAAGASINSEELFGTLPSFGSDGIVAGAVFSRCESITSGPATSTQLESLNDSGKLCNHQSNIGLSFVSSTDHSGIAEGEASLANPPISSNGSTIVSSEIVFSSGPSTSQSTVIDDSSACKSMSTAGIASTQGQAEGRKPHRAKNPIAQRNI